MQLFKRRERRETIVDENSLSDLLLRAYLGDDYIDREKAKSLPAVNGWLGYICDIFAMIPFKLYRKDKNTDGKNIVTEIDDDARVQLINNDTHDTFTGAAFKRAMCEDYLLAGRGYAYINRSGNNVLSINHVESDKLTIEKISICPIFKEFDIYVNGKIYDDFDFIKILRNTTDGINGSGITHAINNSVTNSSKTPRLRFHACRDGRQPQRFYQVAKKA